jgi:hypothetical protein
MNYYRFPCGCQWPLLGEPPSHDEIPLLDFDVEKAPTDCPAAWGLLGKGLTKGVFQLESSLGKTWTKKLKPENLEHIAALGALLRPGCLRAVDEAGVSMTQHYVLRKNGDENLDSYHPSLDRILFPTYGVMVYQEQAMAICVAVAGFNEQDADKLRKAIGKKLPEEMAKCKTMFIEGAAKAGILSEGQAAEVFGWIEKSQRYAFNKCIAGDEIIRRPNGGSHMPYKGYSVERMYRIRNDKQFAMENGHASLHKKWKRNGHCGYGLSMSGDGRVRPNIIRDILFSGRRPVYRVVLEDGRSVRVTANHKFPTSLGELALFDIVRMMSDGSDVRVFVCGEYEPTDFKPVNRFSGLSRKDALSKSSGKAVAGCFGPNNVAYTNGSFTEFTKNDEIIPRVCADCGAIKGRLELHHRDKNRTDSSKENLVRLCSSCHKKRDYALGRIKRGEKGYPSLSVAIREIVPDGDCDTYDVVMDAPNHNFVVGNSDIVVCNSHAACYGVTGYWSAYIKAHFPLAFFTAWLKNAHHKQDPQQEVFELVNDARLFDIAVEPPDLLTLEPHFHTDGKVVKFGLAGIKGVGEAQIQKLKDAVYETSYTLGSPDRWTWWQFLTRFSSKVSSSVVLRLIQSGALRWMGQERSLMEAEFKAWDQLTEKEREWVSANADKYGSLVPALKDLGRPKKEGGGAANKNRVSKIQSEAAMLENPGSVRADTPLAIAYLEEELLGISLTCSRIDSCDISQVNCTCREFLAGRTGFMVLGVEVQTVRKVKTKKGKNPGAEMAFLTVSDSSCSLDEVVAFPEAWAQYRSVLTEGNTVIMQVERDWKDKQSNSVHVQKVWQAVQGGSPIAV